MNIKIEDFSQLQYNVKSLKPKQKVLEVFSELERYSEFNVVLREAKVFLKKNKDEESEEAPKIIDKDKFIKYIIYCYDKKSPFLMEKNLYKRKVLCAIEAGFELNKDGKFFPHIEDAIAGRNELANRMIIRYVRNQRDLRYSLLVSGLENYYDNISKLEERRKGDDAEDSTTKTDLFAKTKKMLDDLEVLGDDLFQGDIELIYTADEVGQEESGNIVSYPEWIAKQRDNGES